MIKDNTIIDKTQKPGITKGLYLVFVFCYIFNHIDLGIFSVAPELMAEYLKCDLSDVGLISSALYIGVVASSLICPFLFAKLKAKHIVVAAAIMNALTVAVFALVENYWVIFASRIFVGLSLGVFIIFSPVWIDLHAPKES